MITQVIFTIDKKLKNQAMKKARSFGLPFSSVLNLATRAFVDGKMSIEMVDAEPFNTKTRRTLTRILKDVEEGKNIIGPFDGPDQMDKFLDSLKK